MSDFLGPILADPAAASVDDLRAAKRLLKAMVALCPNGRDVTALTFTTSDQDSSVTLTAESKLRGRGMLRTVEEELRRRKGK